MTTWNEMRGANLANWRKRNGMRQVDLGDKVGVGKSTISAWERNERAPKPEQIEALHAVADELARTRPQEDAPSRWEVGEGVGASAGDAAASDDDAHVIVIDTRGVRLVADDAVLVERVTDAARGNGVDLDAPQPYPYTTTIDWQRWAVEVDGVRGISLRAMVEAGLYTHYRDAVAALRGHGIQSAEISASSARSGPAPSDHLLTLKDAQRLAARAQTPTGRAILDLIIEHHEEFQRLLAGDADAHERLADAQPSAAHETPADPVMAMLAAAAETRRAQLAHESRLAALEHQMAHATTRLASVDAIHDARTLRPGEVYLSAVARHHGWLTSGGHAYPLAVRLSLACAGRPDYGVRRVMVPSPHAGQADVEALVISQDGLMWWRDHVRPWYEGQAVAGQVRIEPTDAARDAGMTRGCNVHLRGGEG